MQLKISEDIVPVSDFKAQASDWLRKIARTGKPLVITQNGKAAGVLLSPAAFDALTERQVFLTAIQDALEDEAAGRTYSTEEASDYVERRIVATEAE